MTILFLLGNFICPGTFLLGGIFILANSTKKDRYLWVLIPIGLAILFTIMFFLAIVYDSGGTIRFVQIVSLTMAFFLSFLIVANMGVYQRHSFDGNFLTSFFISCLLTITSGGAGVLGSNIIISKCENFHVEVGNIIVNSLEDYYSDRKAYPNNLSELIPQYLHENSIKTCFSIRLGVDDLSSQLEGFYYKKCSAGITQLIIPEMGTRHFHIYDLNDKQWFKSRGNTPEEWGRVTSCY
jgi:hypothetical protein